MSEVTGEAATQTRERAILHSEMGVTEQQIDLYFGWHEKVLLKNMQNHYASLSLRERMGLARITGML